MKIDRDYLFSTLADLIRINSVNPTLAPTGRGEAEISTYVADSLARIGLDVRKFEPEPGRITVAATLKGSGGGRSLMLNAHYDTT
jgi:acetylornithine deacetylase